MAERAGLIIERHPLRQKGQSERRLFVAPEVNDLLDGKVESFPDAAAERVVAEFTAGWLVKVSLSGRPVEGAEPTLERLEGLDEVWALCLRRPRPGWRIFGRFIRQNEFVGLAGYDRHELGERSNYGAIAAKTVELWERAFGPIEPLRGSSIADYVTGVVKDVDRSDA